MRGTIDIVAEEGGLTWFAVKARAHFVVALLFAFVERYPLVLDVVALV